MNKDNPLKSAAMAEKTEAIQYKNDYQEKYYVVKNHEEQYSIWPDFKPIPAGWESIKEPMKREDCLNYIDDVWTDMAADLRGLSLFIVKLH